MLILVHLVVNQDWTMYQLADSCTFAEGSSHAEARKQVNMLEE